MQRVQESTERPAGERLAGMGALMGGERGQAAFARDAFALVVENHRVPVDGDAQLVVAMLLQRRG